VSVFNIYLGFLYEHTVISIILSVLLTQLLLLTVQRGLEIVANLLFYSYDKYTSRNYNFAWKQ